MNYFILVFFNPVQIIVPRDFRFIKNPLALTNQTNLRSKIIRYEVISVCLSNPRPTKYENYRNFNRNG